MITENLSTLKIHKLTQEQYDREFEAGRVDPSALYLTPGDIYVDDIVDFPSSMPANGGNADTVDGKHASYFATANHGTHVTYTTTTPKMNGTASSGTKSTVSRSDHVHPTDTSRASASDLNALKNLVGNTSVSTQIENALANFSSGKTLTEHLAEENMVLTSRQYGDTLPDPGTPGRIFFLKVSD